MLHLYKIILDEEEYEISIEALEEGYELRMGSITHRFVPLLQKPPLYSFLIDNSHVLEADLSFHMDQCELNVQNLPYRLEVFDPRRRIISQNEVEGRGGLLQAPMPGKVIEIKVAVGDSVSKGQALVIIEAMKMQNELTTPIDGVVKEVAVKVGDTTEAGQKLIVVAKP
jgi:biotin carboxyl carrier protein